ncbi:MAG: FAD-dependent oxidoreductase, partial [Coriobacteriales bacterium]|nr:FAD-dependent oxidoreductase [Coriobacteriales bacterium]
AHDAAAAIELVSSKYMRCAPEQVVNQTSTAEVEEIITSFAEAARRCMRAGFDLIVLHGGHGNVPAMFFREKDNHRSDRFGGSFEGRCRFGIELLQALREATEGRLAIEYRISAEEMVPGFTTLEETIAYSQVIEDYIDLLHVSRGMLEYDELLPSINAPVYLPKAMNLPFAARFKQALSIPVTVVGSFDLRDAEQAVAAGKVDAVSMIRTVLADTECVEKARLNRAESIRPCIRCNTCIDRTHSDRISIQCAVNPLVGRETRFSEGPAQTPRRVMIVGAGVAGLEAARVAARRGHQVSLFEKDESAGGLFRLACASELKRELQAYLSWSIADVMANERIELHLDHLLSADEIHRANPDALILAFGAQPILPNFSASASDKVVWVGDVEAGRVECGKTVVIAGAGVTGMEAALSLARQGRQVTLVDALREDQLGAGTTAINLIALRALLAEADVTFICESRISDIDEAGVHLTTSCGEHRCLNYDTAVLSFGFRVDRDLLESFSGIVEPTYTIGDCSGRGGNLHNALRTAFEKAMLI